MSQEDREISNLLGQAVINWLEIRGGYIDILNMIENLLH